MCMGNRTILIFEPFCTENLDLIKEAAGSEFTLQQLDAGCDENSLEDAIKPAEIIVGQPPLKRLLPAETKCPELRFIQMTWAGTDQYTQSSILFPKDRIAPCKCQRPMLLCDAFPIPARLQVLWIS